MAELLRKLPCRGTLLNTLSVVVGGLIGFWLGDYFSPSMKQTVIIGFGFTTIGLGIRLFIDTKNVTVVALSLTIGGIFGAYMGLGNQLVYLGKYFQEYFQVGGRFSDAFTTTTLLFCLSPLAFMGCAEEAIKQKTALLRLKSLMDGISSIFFTAMLGPGVFLTAAFVLLFQSILTLVIKRLKGVFSDQHLLADMMATGGLILVSMGFSIVGLKRLPTENFVPAVAVAPVLSHFLNRKRTSVKSINF